MQQSALDRDVCARALAARDPRFDGVFFVGITTTRIYCRPVCPSRAARDQHRRYFDSAAAAERAGFRPCLRCRPELAPGRAMVDGVSRLARAALHRIASGALNGRTVACLAHDLGVGERHLRRVLERELGVSPLELARTHRLLLAKQLLVDSDLSVTRVAYASGFQSLRRFNAEFRERYGVTPSEVRGREHAGRSQARSPSGTDGVLRLTLAYRPPFAWDTLLACLARDAVPGVEVIAGGRYARTVDLGGHRGVVIAEDRAGHLAVAVSLSLLPALMPLIAGLRRLFDLDADPEAIDGHLTRAGLGAQVARNPGVRIAGALCGFDVALAVLLHDGGNATPQSRAVAGRVASALGEELATGVAGLSHLAPTAARLARGDVRQLVGLGMTPRRAAGVMALAHAVAEGALCLEPGSDVAETRRALFAIDGVSEHLATAIVMRTLCWPDAFPAGDPALQHAAGVNDASALSARAEPWRPWRAYAAQHLWLAARTRVPEPVELAVDRLAAR